MRNLISRLLPLRPQYCERLRPNRNSLMLPNFWDEISLQNPFDQKTFFFDIQLTISCLMLWDSFLEWQENAANCKQLLYTSRFQMIFLFLLNNQRFSFCDRLNSFFYCRDPPQATSATETLRHSSWLFEKVNEYHTWILIHCGCSVKDALPPTA